MSDEAARASAIDPRHSVLVQAPAGSGKTTLLTQRLLALLAAVEAPERILALTFTRKAAAEMRSRVLEALRQAASDAQGRLPALTWELAQRAHRHMLERGVDLVRHPARLRIETIDGFCAWLAAQLPVTSGAGGRIGITEDASRLYREAAERALAGETPAFEGAVDRALQLNDEFWRAARDRIAGMLESRNSWLAGLAGRLRAASDLGAEDEREVRRLLDEDLTLLIERHLESAAEALGGERLQTLHALLSAAALRLDASKTVLASWRSPPAALRPEASQVAYWRELAGIFLTSSNGLRRSFDVRVGFAPNTPDKARVQGLAAELARDESMAATLAGIRSLPDPGYDDAQWERVRALARTLILAAAELDALFRVRSTGDFQAVFQAAMQSLGTASEPTDLALLLDHRIEHILVDECQDTSNAQLDLFKLLTAGWQPRDGRSFFCVGDPMQSIYGFREAEVRVFLELAEEGMGSLPLSPVRLSSNFRAQPPLVDWVNTTFSRIFPRRDDRHRGAIAFAPAVARVPAERADAGVHLRLFDSAGEEAEFIAQAVQAALARAGVPPDAPDGRQHAAQRAGGRIAILVRNKRHAWPISEALRARGIACRALDIGRLQDVPVVRDIIVLSRALLHFEDRIAWLALLRAPFVGLTLKDLAMLSSGGATLWQALNDPAMLDALSDEGAARAQRCAQVLRRAFEARDQCGFARWVERTWMALGGAGSGLDARDRACARTALDRLAWLDEAGLPDPTQLEDAFEKLSPAAEGEQNVEIMTIHKAKGLEFDVVFVPALQAVGSQGSSELIQTLAFARADRPGFALAARAEAGEEADALLKFLRQCERDAQMLEAQRLLYVACTRARSQLHLSAYRYANRTEDRAQAQERAFSPRAGSLLQVLWPIAANDFLPTKLAVPTAKPAPVLLRRLPVDWSPPEPTVEDAPAASEPLPLTPPFDWAGEAARQVGVLVHRCLQELRCEERAVHEVQARSASFRRWFQARGMPAEQIEVAVQRVIDALLAVLADERGRWILDSRPPRDARELALSAKLDGRVVNVVLDRTFVESGERWVIDYKTSLHAGGQLQAFLDSEMQRYSEQMRRYARVARLLGPESVRIGLYFPLLREFREWREE